MPINFDSIVQEAMFLSPFNNFEPDQQGIEKRLDPLTKDSSTLFRTMIERGVKLSVKMDKDEINRISEKSREGCFMCPELVDKTTPKFASEIVAEGRLRVGRVILFPNILALSRHTAVMTIPDRHFLDLDEFTPDVLGDCLHTAIEFVKRVHAADPGAGHAVIGCNYMFPAGSSTVHTHFHIFLDSTPFDLVKRLLDESERYHAANSANYWADLVEAEKQRGKLTLARGPGHERQVGTTVGEAQSFGMLPVFFDTDAAVVKDRFADLVTVLFLEDAVDRKQRSFSFAAELVEEILAEDASDHRRVGGQLLKRRGPTVAYQH